ncbi:MAG TPA: outer membrane protein assembly factor BamA [Gammaproteobacteria bacterium]|nr:outer membrane protein assembly factor BamA [Gammaproteobacteria bacterium]
MKKNITRSFLILGLTLSLFAQAAPIKSIEILGLNVVSRGTVLSYLPVEAGDEYGKKTSGQIIRALHKTGFFKDVEVSQDDQILKIKIQENPHIKYIEIINYSDKVIQQDSLDRILQNMNLSQGKIFNARQLDKLIKQLDSAYVVNGYYNTKITKTIETDNHNRVGINLDISEGEVARIGSMKISGNIIHSEKELLDLFDIGESDFFVLNYFTEKDHYSKIALDAGVEAMKSLYTGSGYLDFKINKIDTSLSDDKKTITVDIQISEGAQYKIGGIQFTGDLLNQSIDDLRDLLIIAKDDVFQRKKIVKSIQAITDVFADQGYAFAKINPITSEDKKNHTIALNINVDLNQKIYINRITITGNTRTQDGVIRREIGLSEGSLYSNSELNESVKKIRRLGYFSDVKMNVSKLKNTTDKINIHFDLTETKTGQMSIGVTQSNSSGTSFNFGIQEKNFLGTGNTLNVSFSSSKAVTTGSFYFEDPYFTDDKSSVSYGVFSKTLDGLELVSNAYKIDESGVSLGYGIPLTETTRVNSKLRVSKRDLTCTDTFKLDEPEQCPTTGNEINETDVNLNLNWSGSTLNQAHNPTEGSKNSLDFNASLPMSDYRYYKLNASHKKYQAINKNLTLKIRGNVGLAQGYGGKEVPFFERYYGGGSSSIRGFKFNSLGPTYSNLGQSGNAKGGELSVLTGVSIISPMKFIKDSDNMRMSAFIDAGGIYDKTSNFTFDELRMSTGVAFSWLTPIGPLGIYAAKPLIKKPNDETTTFEFTIGSTF